MWAESTERALFPGDMVARRRRPSLVTSTLSWLGYSRWTDACMIGPPLRLNSQPTAVVLENGQPRLMPLAEWMALDQDSELYRVRCRPIVIDDDTTVTYTIQQACLRSRWMALNSSAALLAFLVHELGWGQSSLPFSEITLEHLLPDVDETTTTPVVDHDHRQFVWWMRLQVTRLVSSSVVIQVDDSPPPPWSFMSIPSWFTSSTQATPETMPAPMLISMPTGEVSEVV